MVLERHSGVLRLLLDPLTRLLKSIHPNVITWMALPFAVLAAALIWRGDPATEPRTFYLLWASLAVAVMGILDLLDGRIARLTERSSAVGDFLDHVMDRWLDIILIVAISFSPWADLRVGLFAIVGTLLTSYMGTQAQAVGAGRVYGGVLTRADRVVLLIAAPLVDHFFTVYGYTIPWALPGGQYVLGLALWYFAIMGTFTSLQRFVMIYLFLRKETRTGRPDEPDD